MIYSIVIIIGLVILLVLHTQTLLENKRLWSYIQPDEVVCSRHIYVTVDRGGYMDYLIRLDLEAHDQMKIGVLSQNTCNGVTTISYDNGDESIIIKYGEAKINKLIEYNIDHYSHRVFFDHKLPDSAFRAVIDSLGLKDYMIGVGICTERSVGNGKDK